MDYQGWRAEVEAALHRVPPLAGKVPVTLEDLDDQKMFNAYMSGVDAAAFVALSHQDTLFHNLGDEEKIPVPRSEFKDTLIGGFALVFGIGIVWGFDIFDATTDPSTWPVRNALVGLFLPPITLYMAARVFKNQPLKSAFFASVLLVGCLLLLRWQLPVMGILPQNLSQALLLGVGLLVGWGLAWKQKK